MSGLFLTGKIKTLLDRITATRATALDSITETRLARLDATISSRQSEANASSRFSSLEADIAALAGGRIKSIQTGYFGTSGLTAASGEDARYVDVTISSVDTSKSVVLVDGIAGTRTYASGSLVTARLTSATNLRLASSDSGAASVYARWTVVEYY